MISRFSLRASSSRTWAGAALAVTIVSASACRPSSSDAVRADSAASTAKQGPADGEAPGDAQRGLALLNNFRDSLPTHSGNALRCTSCHLDNGTRPTGLPWLGSAARYPQYRARPGYSENMERRINECIARSLAGKMIPEDGRDMRDMVAYMESLREHPRPPDNAQVKLAGNIDAGREGWVGQCARCHGVNGEGINGLSPAMWGPDSYSVGAGMARQFTLATFMRHNMPYDKASVLTDQQSADIAAYILAQPRQDHPGKERDWPNGDPPADVAYATDSARAAGKAMPAARQLLPRRVSPDSLSR